MSGFEIAGVVLGALPLVITALEHYGEGIKTIKTMLGYQALVANLILDLKIETRSFQRGCENLLWRLQLPSEEAEELLKFPKGRKWFDPELHTKIQKMLGCQDYAIYEQLVLRLFARLDNFSKKVQLDDDFLPRWMKGSAHTGKPSAFTKVLGKTRSARRTFEAIMLGLQSGDYALAIADIRSDVEKIGSLVGDAMVLAAPRQERSRRLNTKFWSSIRQYAESLFQSIRWQCHCAPSHTVHLQLQTRDKTIQGAESTYNFIILFAFSGGLNNNSSPMPWSWRRAKVRPSEIPQARVAGSVAFAGVGEVPSPTAGSEISSLCKALENAPEESGCIGFLDHQECRHHIFCGCEEQTRTVMSLEQVLQEKCMCRYNYGIKERYKLSVTLASTVLQLCRTPWLQSVWGKNDIYFMKSEEAPLTDQLYVRKSEHTTTDQVAQALLLLGLRTWSNSSLFALATVLVELYFGRPLETIPNDPSELDELGNPLPYGQTEEKKLNRLIRGIDSGTQEKEAAYFQAIKRCLRCNFDTDSLDLTSSHFQEVFYTDVIAPLESCYETMM
ncbi:hypothetical protein ONS95_004760 [Cadophora gregata]|uniref:uncharacterized protein n=1 Tax=Cadophora gregata TaxID=51156 RepID=UPI0026DA99C8|nr:uncharacterized protein ONS95_004760 [Cadophora gregata]KAK0104471.1 hypothetical protein ONS95_004760 [Cadophora gregata]KAK0115437.1 hypothetical protein ONS96_013893 [Cadophora gregata f. sp. sojae]